MADEVDGPSGQSDLRRDHVLRTLVSQSQPVLEPRGFHLAARGGFDGASWVRFERPTRVGNKPGGTELLLLAHGQRDQTLVADLYAEDARLHLHTPQHRVVHRYDEPAAWMHGVGTVIDAIGQWLPPSG